MKHRYAVLMAGFALISGVFWLSSLHADRSGAERKDQLPPVHFASAANYITHEADNTQLQQLRCLALNIYWEARSESTTGQLAVAAVTLNRVKNPNFPSDVCTVVRQGGEIRRHRCQFSWWCDGKKDKPVNTESWRRAMTLARLITAGVVKDPTHGALWYHADYVTPNWAEQKQRVAKIGRHIFYTDADARPLRVSQNAVAERIRP